MYSLIIKKKNYGIQILRMIMSFWVVMNHIYKTKNKSLKNIIIEHRFHVPTFIIISFYFLNNNLVKRNINKINERLERLLIPYILYPTLNYIIFNFFYIFFNAKSLAIKFESLITQLIIGRGIFNVLWFNFNLIFLIILFHIISFLFKSNYLLILQIIGIFAYLAQFSDYNFIFFNKYSNRIKFSVGYIVETIPLAITGLWISSLDIINKLKNSRFKAIFFSFFFIFFFFKYDVFKQVKGFGKQGLMYNIGGCFFFISFSLLPLDNINKKFIILINYITNFTAGIYILHTKIYYILKNEILSINFNNGLGCLYIYIICYLICMICYNILKKTKLKYLFI